LHFALFVLDFTLYAFHLKFPQPLAKNILPNYQSGDAQIDSPEGDEAEILSIFIEKYEEEHDPIEAPDPNWPGHFCYGVR